jgi:hypothetical protein
MPDTVTRGRKPRAKPKTPPRPVLFVELPDHFAHIKPQIGRLARRHARKISAEICVALTEYIQRHGGEEGAEDAR